MFENTTRFKNYIKNKSNELNIDISYGYQNYLLQCFAMKVSKSKYRDEFIYRGGFVLSSLIGIETRTTMDIDITTKSKTYTREELELVLNEICSIEIDCPFSFCVDHITDEMNSRNEVGYKVILYASFDNLRFNIKIDIACDAFVYPKDIDSSIYGSIIEKSIDVLAYPVENIVAEKFETIIDRGVTNSRMRDYYDLYIILSDEKKYKVNETKLVKTIFEVSKNRQTVDTILNSKRILDDIEKSNEFKNYWSNYINDINIEARDIAVSAIFKILKDLALKYESNFEKINNI